MRNIETHHRYIEIEVESRDEIHFGILQGFSADNSNFDINFNVN